MFYINNRYNFHTYITDLKQKKVANTFLQKFYEILTSFSTVFFILFFISILSPVKTFTQEQLAKGKSKFLGCGTSSYLFRDIDKYWNQVTPGNGGKRGSVSSVRGQYNWTNLDKIYNYAINRGLFYKHHTFVLGQQYPVWITSLDSANQREQIMVFVIQKN
jgi:GH35 family endo-1,4-beta-xylanase